MTYLDLVMSGFLHGLIGTLPIGSSDLARWQNAMAADDVSRALIDALATAAILPSLAITLRQELAVIGRGIWRLVKGRFDASVRLLGLIVCASLPLVAADWFAPHDFGIPTILLSAAVMAAGLWLLLADLLGVTVREMDHLSAFNLIAIGITQAVLSVIGIPPILTTIGMARLAGCERDQAAKLALLTSIPHLIGMVFMAVHAVPHGTPFPPALDAAMIAAPAFAAALLAVGSALTWVRRHSFLPFAVAEILLGTAAAAMAFL